MRLISEFGGGLYRNQERDDTVSKWISVLVIEDDEIVQMALKRSLKLYGFKVYPRTGKETSINSIGLDDAGDGWVGSSRRA